VTLAPTAAILPSRSTIVPFRIVGPAAVRMVALRIATTPDGTGRYVLGKGSAFGAATAPAPGGVGGVESFCVAAAVCGEAAGAAVAGGGAARPLAQPRTEAIATNNE